MMTSNATLLGVAAMVAATALMPLSDALAKSLVAEFSAEQVSFVRNATHAALLAPVVLLTSGGGAVMAQLTWLQLLRALCFVLMTTCYVAGLRSTPLAEAMATVFAFPCLVLAASALFLGERVGPRRWGAALAGFAGVAIVANASFDQAGTGLIWVFAAALFTAAYMVLTKAVTSKGPILVMGLMPALIGSVLLLGPGLAAWQPPSFESAGLMVMVGCVAASPHLLIVLAYARAEASLIAPLAYLQIVSATFLGFMLFGDLPALSAWVGIAIIIASGGFIAFRERRVPTGAAGRR